MQTLIGILIVSVLSFPAAMAFCQSQPVEGAISDEEYGIYRLVAEKLEGRCPVDTETLDGLRVDAQTMTSAGEQQPDGAIIEDFNRKNVEKHTLSESFVREMATGAGNGFEGRKKAAFSRIAFDRQRRRALLVMGMTFYHPEDLTNAGTYVFLEKENQAWAIRRTAEAWPTTLGPIR